MTPAQTLETLARVANNSAYISYLEGKLAEVTSALVFAENDAKTRQLQGQAQFLQTLLNDLEAAKSRVSS